MKSIQKQIRQAESSQKQCSNLFDRYSSHFDRMLNAICLYFERSESVKDGPKEKQKKTVLAVKFTLMISVSALIILFTSKC
jgi:hypothetical protein